MFLRVLLFSFFFFNDTATTEIYTLSLHDALPISDAVAVIGTSPEVKFNDPSDFLADAWIRWCASPDELKLVEGQIGQGPVPSDRKSTRLNSSHLVISYAVFCLKKKNNRNKIQQHI